MRGSGSRGAQRSQSRSLGHLDRWHAQRHTTVFCRRAHERDWAPAVTAPGGGEKLSRGGGGSLFVVSGATNLSSAATPTGGCRGLLLAAYAAVTVLAG